MLFKTQHYAKGPTAQPADDSSKLGCTTITVLNLSDNTLKVRI